MKSTIKQHVEQCVEEFRAGTLTEGNLVRILELLDHDYTEPKCQELLYLQAVQTSLNARVFGMRILQNGKLSDGPRNPEEWPYKTVLDAILDGWRVIKFPEMVLLLDDKRTYGLGCEFILEKWR